MRPDENKPIQVPTRQITTSPPDRSRHAQQTAAANLVRGSIDHIYDNQAAQESRVVPTQSQPTPQDDTAQQQPTAVYTDSYAEQQAEPTQNTYNRSHTAPHATEAGNWQNYHSAWQDYYQKYYEQYYVGAVHQVHSAYSQKAFELEKNGGVDLKKEGLSQDEAMYDLRQQLMQKVQDSGKKVRKSRHFMPIVAALSVLLIFGFLQYNRVIISNVKAYVTPGEIDPQNIIVNPNASLEVSDEPRLIIPKINVNVPVDYSAKPDYDSQMKSMESGVAYFGIPGADSKPGQIGTTAIAGHSSNDFIDNGDFKFVFALLERLDKGDVFYLNYEGTRYTYTVNSIKVVLPTNIDALTKKTDKPLVTLITCTPLGTAQKRLLVTAEQISPSPDDAEAASTTSTATDVKLPGNSPTIVERLFGN